MKSRRAAFSLLLVTLLAVASEPAADSIPEVCREGLPLPSEYEFRKSEYQLLRAGRHRQARIRRRMPRDLPAM